MSSKHSTGSGLTTNISILKEKAAPQRGSPQHAEKEFAPTAGHITEKNAESPEKKPTVAKTLESHKMVRPNCTQNRQKKKMQQLKLHHTFLLKHPPSPILWTERFIRDASYGRTYYVFERGTFIHSIKWMREEARGGGGGGGFLFKLLRIYTYLDHRRGGWTNVPHTIWWKWGCRVGGWVGGVGSVRSSSLLSGDTVLTKELSFMVPFNTSSLSPQVYVLYVHSLRVLLSLGPRPALVHTWREWAHYPRAIHTLYHSSDVRRQNIYTLYPSIVGVEKKISDVTPTRLFKRDFWYRFRVKI